MKTTRLLVPMTITTTARLALAFGPLLIAILLIQPGPSGENLIQLSSRLDHAAGLELLAFTAFLASHRLRRVDLVNNLSGRAAPSSR